ncbi:hypothetical protein BKA56DRAFT_448431, partial [Ilyonectria sp. MPI-CAGE-AT-0026]
VFLRWLSYLRPTAREVPRSLTVPTNLGIFFFSAIFHLFYAYDAIQSKNTIQVGFSCIFSIMLLFFTILQYLQVKNAAFSLAASFDVHGSPLVHEDMDFWPLTGRLLLSMSGIVALCSALLMIIAWRVRAHFSWQALHNVGADAQMRRKRLMYQVYLMLLKLEVYTTICFLAVYSVPILRMPGYEFYLNISAVPLISLVPWLSIICIRRENIIGTSIGVQLAGMVYFVYKMVIIHTGGHGDLVFEVSYTLLVLFGSVSMFLITLTATGTVICMSNFRKGLSAYLKR